MSRDPYWLAARFAGACACGAAVKKGDRIFYYPNGRRVCGAACGCAERASRDFEACCMDEATMGGCY